jgi:DNA repair exonuclease SbcCD nuclease subunit
MRLLILADLHIGAIKEVNYIHNILTDIFDKEIKFNKTDAVIICGDIFHKSLKVNEDYTALTINIMSYLVDLCKDNNTKIRIIYGTESHEANQMHLFNYHSHGSHVDFRIIDRVCTEELFPNVNVLYVPEEYVESKEEYYKDFLYSGNKYDYIFGHGVIIEGMPMSQFDISAKSNEKKVPHFKSKELSDIAKIVVYGHWHSHCNMGNNCYYLGSLFRDSFGEETPKGYGIIEDDKFKFIENKEAYIYKTYTYEENSDIYKDTNNLINEIKKIKEENIEIFNNEKFGKIRIIFKMPLNIDITFKEKLRTLLFNDKIICPLIKESSELISEIENEVEEEYDFILDNSLNTIDKIHRYINKVYEHQFTMEELSHYINDELKI